MFSQRDGKARGMETYRTMYTLSNRSTWQERLLPSVVPGASVLKATGVSRSVTGSRSVIGTELAKMSFLKPYINRHNIYFKMTL